MKFKYSEIYIQYISRSLLPRSAIVIIASPIASLDPLLLFLSLLQKGMSSSGECDILVWVAYGIHFNRSGVPSLLFYSMRGDGGKRRDNDGQMPLLSSSDGGREDVAAVFEIRAWMDGGGGGSAPQPTCTYLRLPRGSRANERGIVILAVGVVINTSLGAAVKYAVSVVCVLEQNNNVQSKGDQNGVGVALCHILLCFKVDSFSRCTRPRKVRLVSLPWRKSIVCHFFLPFGLVSNWSTTICCSHDNC